jgi:hypothetical protein
VWFSLEEVVLLEVVLLEVSYWGVLLVNGDGNREHGEWRQSTETMKASGRNVGLKPARSTRSDNMSVEIENKSATRTGTRGLKFFFILNR